jgi:UTP--glucose-1-phosphate uridylyltransferase
MQATHRKITKAVFPVAGFGTRSLPATKAIPKEMLPIVDKPLIQYAAEEAIAAGAKELIFITSTYKSAIEDHFDVNFELEAKLKESHKNDLLEIVHNVLPKDVSFVAVRQTEQLGLGHAVLCAKEVVGNEPFMVLLPDDLIISATKPCLAQMLEIYQATNNSVLAVQEVPLAETEKYGIVGLNQNDSQLITSIIEKPKANAPSNLAVVGRYILTPEIFKFLEETKAGAVGEIQLTDGIAKILTIQKVNICRFEGKRYDCGSKLGFLQANVECALQHKEVGAQFKKYLQELKIK